MTENVRITITMKKTQGDPNELYGLAFREKDDGNGSNVTCYAFGIKLNGMSTVLKYNPNAQNNETSLGGSTNPVPGFKAGLNQLHILQAVVQGSKFFFKIDNQPVPVSPAPDQSIADSTYTGGQFTLYVSGSTANFVVIPAQFPTQSIPPPTTPPQASLPPH